MKILGQSLNRDYTKLFNLPRPNGNTILLRLKPLPLGFHRQLRSHGIISPVPPARVARDSAGRPLRDERGIAVLMEDEQDKEYQAAWELHHQRVAVLVMAEALRADDQVQFETPRPEQSGDWSMYADQLYDELEQAGFSAGDLIMICDEVCKMSNLISEHIHDAQIQYSASEL